ncbi:MAG: ABC transporter permease [Cytophagaceae bacterium]|nr:ABC transporter permease [Gemmatimonadaceae bacterium]
MKKTFRITDAQGNAPREVRDELEFHLAMRTREFIEQGMDPGTARRAAQASFGDVTEIEDELRGARTGRDERVRRREWFGSVAQDVRHAIRGFFRRPLFAASVIAALSVGIGAAGSVFAVVNGVLLRPLPYARPAELAMLWLSMPATVGPATAPLSPGFFDLARTRSSSFQSLAAFRSAPGTLGEADDTERVAGVRATAALFTTLGVRPILGRTFSPEDDVPGAPRVVVLSEVVWQGRFGGDRNVLGRRVMVSGERHEVIGVMPRGFSFPRGAELLSGLQFGRNTDLWTPLALAPADLANYGTQNLAVVGRLVAGRTTARAEEEFTSLVAAVLREAGVKIQLEASVVGLKEQAARPVQRGLLLLLGSVVVVLLIACANVAALLATRVSERHRELAVRLALGAVPGRVGRQLLTEMLVLAMAGGVGGAIATWGGTRLLLSLVPGDLPRSDDISVGWAVLVAVGTVAVVCGVVFGVICMRRVRASDATDTLRGATRSTDTAGVRHGRRLLVTAQVALSVLLLVGAGLLLRSFGNLQAIEPGFTARGAFTGEVNIPIAGAFNPARDAAGWRAFFDQFVTRVSQLPGVDAVGAVSALPLTGTAEGGGFAIVGREPPPPESTPRTAYAVSHGDYFRAAGIALRAGRAFDATDRSDAPAVAIVSRALAEQYFPGQDPVGQQVNATFEFTRSAPARTIIGVVDDVKLSSLDGETMPTMYVPEQQMSYPGLSLVVRTDRDAEALLPALRRELRATHATATLSGVRSLEEVLRQSLARQRFTLLLIAAFATTALLLAVLGVYGVIAMSVQARRHELGVRLALGARPGSLVGLVVREGMQLAGLGVVLGVAGAVGLSGVLRALLYGVSAWDASIYLAAAVAVVGVTALATWIPARRAARGNPTEALRDS